MISSITLSYNRRVKNNFEEFLITNPEFKEVIVKKDLKSGITLSSIEVNADPLFYKVDNFNGYLRANLRHVYSHYNSCNFPLEFKYTQLVNSIDEISSKTFDIKKSSLSRLSVVFYLESSIASTQLVKTHILMHKLSEYSHDKKSMKDKNLKEFVYHNYILGIYSNSKNKNLISKKFKIELNINKSVVLKNLGIYIIEDLKDKSKLRNLFSFFLQKFDELTIIDEIKNYESFSKTDEENIKKYLNPVFWSGLTVNNKRNEKLKHKKEFLRIQKKYDLNKIKNEIRNSIERSFENFINN